MLVPSTSTFDANNCVVNLKASGSGYGQFKCDGTLQFTGTSSLNKEYYVDCSSTRWFNMSTGLDGGKIEDLAEVGSNIVSANNNTGSVFIWNSSNSQWTAPNIYSSHAPTTGFTIYGGNSFLRSGAGTIDISSTSIPNTGDYSSLTLNYHDGTGSNASLFGPGAVGWGWNIFANPYTCSLDWDAQDDNLPANTNNAIYTWTGSTYASYVNGVSNGSGLDQYIAPGQAFWVQTQDDFVSGSMTIEYANTSVDGTPGFLKTNPDMARLTVEETNGSKKKSCGCSI